MGNMEQACDFGSDLFSPVLTGDLVITEPGMFEEPAFGVTSDLHPSLALAAHLFRGQHIFITKRNDWIGFD
jgi:hypothetical protein